MRKTTITLAAVAALFAATPSLAQDYVAGSIGTDLGRSEIGGADVNQYGAAVGRDFGQTRVEATYSDLTNVDGQDVSADTVALNAYLEPYKFGRVTPFVGVGVGYSWLEGRNATDEGFTTNIAAGAEVEINDRFSVVGEVRRYNFASDARTSVASIGVRYTF